MRIAFVTLLVCNLLLAAWLLSVSPAGPPPPPPVPEDLPRLELLAERDRPQQAEQTPATPAQEASGGERLCYRVGPLQTEADARALTGRLAGRIASQALEREQVEARIGHWVFLPAFPDRSTAMDAARRLHEAGMRDYYVITAGDQENTISLGLYRDPGNAAGRVRTLRERGFDAQSRVRTENVPRYYLELALAGEVEPDWPELLEGHPEARAQERACDEQ